MNIDLIPMLRCPTGCASDIELRSDKVSDSGEVTTGALHCISCGEEYPISRGIAKMLPHKLKAQTDASDDHTATRKRSEMRARDDQVKAYERMWHLNVFGLLEIPVAVNRLSLASDHILLEAGCGTGRMTSTFAKKCDRLIAVDFSLQSLRRNQANLRKAGVKNVDLIQADICHLPLKTEVVNRVVSCGVIEHIPTPESRLTASQEMARVLKGGGKLVISAYQYSMLTRMFSEKEGEHDGGIYFYRFTRNELRQMLSQAMNVEAITGLLVYYYVASCAKPV